MTPKDQHNLDSLVNRCVKNDRKAQKELYKLFYSKMKQDRVAGLIKMMDHFLPVTIPAEKAKLLLDLAKGAESEADVHKMVQYMMCMPEYQMC